MEKYRRRESLKDLAHELDLLFPHGYDGISNMDQGRRLRDEKIKDLRKTNGTLQEGYERILKDLKHARGRRYILREYYKKVNKILQDTRAISREELKEFLAGAENYNADLGNKRYTILIAGETSAGKSSLINLLLNDHVLPTAITQNTHTICEISYGVKKEAVIHFSKSSKPARILHENKFAKIKEYIEKPVQDEDSCKRIEIKIPNLLLKVKDHKLLFLLLVFDLCTGSLKNHIFKNDDRIPWKTPNAAVDTVQWTKQILDAIEFIHSQNIVHRDLKLDNILMSRHDHIKVADLGLAKLQGRILGTVCGTPLYMAPEVHDGKPYCTKADMYSFGLMMWEMWFGKTVFSELRCQRGELLRRIKVENYRPQTPRSDGRFAPNLPPAQWTEVMTSCWQTESSLRKTAAESKDFVKEIKHSLAGI